MSKTISWGIRGVVRWGGEGGKGHCTTKKKGSLRMNGCKGRRAKLGTNIVACLRHSTGRHDVSETIPWAIRRRAVKDKGHLLYAPPLACPFYRYSDILPLNNVSYIGFLLISTFAINCPHFSIFTVPKIKPFNKIPFISLHGDPCNHLNLGKYEKTAVEFNTSLKRILTLLVQFS